MGARGDQVGDRGAGIAAFDQTLTDQHGVGTGTGVGQQVAGAAHTGLGDPDDVGLGRPGAMRAKQSRSTSSVLRSRALTPITLAPAFSARSASSSVCTSTRAVMPSDSVRSSIDTSADWSSAATISSSMSAPCARASWI